jgi:hypothetical protein
VIPVVLPNAEIDKVTGFLSLNTWIDLRNRLDDPAELDALARAVKGEPPAEQTVAAEPLCPYRGLEPFHEDDAPLFFGRDEEARTLGEALAERKIPLDDPIAATLAAAKNVNRLLLVVDQFEELFTLSEERYRQPFIESLIAAAARADSPVTVVLTLRADFYGQAIGLSRSLSDSIQQGFEPGLATRLLDDIKGQPGNLPLLEFALKELWLRRQGGTITNEQYDVIGTLEGAISKRADAQLERVPPAEREAVLRAFTRLVCITQRWERMREWVNKDRKFLLWRQRLGLRMSFLEGNTRDVGVSFDTSMGILIIMTFFFAFVLVIWFVWEKINNFARRLKAELIMDKSRMSSSPRRGKSSIIQIRRSCLRKRNRSRISRTKAF